MADNRAKCVAYVLGVAGSVRAIDRRPDDSRKESLSLECPRKVKIA